jgi:uncharacterized protein YbaP (TraB family)
MRLCFLKIAPAVALGVLGAVLIARAKSVPSIGPAVPPARSGEPAGPGRGLVWKIEGGSAPVFLAGSLHLLRREDLPHPSTLEAAYQGSQQVWFEVPPGDMQKPAAAATVMALGMLPADESLADVIPAETNRKVEAWAAENPALAPVLERMRPWLAAMTIMLTEYQRMGVGPEHGIEQILMTRAREDGKKTGGFETVQQQLSFFGDLTPDKQQALLDKTFEDLAQSREHLAEMIAHWRAGRDQELAARMNQSFAGHHDLKKRLLDDRNAAWIDPLEKLLAGDRATLVVVGAGHLAGEGSVVDLLQKKGWKLTRLEPVP